VGCGEQPKPSSLNRVTETAVTPDAGVASTSTPTDDGPPTAGTDADALARVFDLGSAPSVPKAFGALRPGMPRKDAARARPKTWGDAWTYAATDDPGVVLSAGAADASDDPLEHLTVEVTQHDAAKRLATAWGAPALTAFHGGTVCWLSTGAHLKACHEKDLQHDQVELAVYRPLADALKDPAQAPSSVVAYVGQNKRDVMKAYPRGVELTDPKDPSKHRVECTFNGTEYSAGVAGDRVVFFLDKDEKVIAAHLWFNANDPAVRPQVIEKLKAAADGVKGGKDLLVTVRDEDPAAVVVVLDGSPGLTR
jgi:hypothetical protein